MGAAFETTYIPGTQTARDAYTKARDEAHFERGHDPYNGSITTTDGVITIESRLVPLKVAQRMADELANSNRLTKWGSAGAIAVGAQEGYTRSERTITLTTGACEYWEVLAELADAAKAKARPGELVESVTITGDSPKWRSVGKRNTEKARTVFEVRGSNRTRPVQFDKRAEAEKYAKAQMAEWMTSGEGCSLIDADGRVRYERPVEFSVHAVVQAGDADELLRLIPELQSRRVTATVTYAKEKKTLTQDGWLFCYWAAT